MLSLQLRPKTASHLSSACRSVQDWLPMLLPNKRMFKSFREQDSKENRQLKRKVVHQQVS